MALRIIFIKEAREISYKNKIQRNKGTKFNTVFILSTSEGTRHSIRPNLFLICRLWGREASGFIKKAPFFLRA